MDRDLSTEHKPVSDFLDRDTRVEDSVAAFQLSDEQIEFFHENGYVAGIRILSDEQVEQLRKELSRLFDPEHD